MFKFMTMTDAAVWASRVARRSPCSVIIHGDPYEWHLDEDDHMVFTRKYVGSFYSNKV